MNKVKKIGKWCLAVFCLLCTIAAIPSAGAIIFFIISLALMPIYALEEPVNKLLEKIPYYKKWMKYAALCIAFIMGMSLMSPSGNNGSVTTDSVAAIQTEATESVKEIAKSTEEAAERTEEVTQSTEETEETEESTEKKLPEQENPSTFDSSIIPAYSGNAFVVINDNIPFFGDSELSTTSFENYGSLDSLGRCTTCIASVGIDIMPTGERENIGAVKPTGWHTVKYNFVDGKYLYNRCHLIGYQLTGENANTKNLITGTRYLNIEGMLPFENMVADYVKETENHVMYRVTPVFSGSNLLADGVLMEGKSVEDNGEGILFCVYAYNVQPGVAIDYATGDSSADGTISEKAENSDENKTSDTSGSAEKQTPTDTTQPQDTAPEVEQTQPSAGATYILNTNTHKFHYPGCSSAKRISPKNYAEFSGTREELINAGYDPCGNCNP